VIEQLGVVARPLARGTTYENTRSPCVHLEGIGTHGGAAWKLQQ